MFLPNSPPRVTSREVTAFLRRNALMVLRSPRKLLYQLMKTEFVRLQYGVLMRANWHDTTFNYCYRGSYGRALSSLLARHERPFVFLDIGANQGLYSLLAAKNPHCTQALAFEPVARTHDLLVQNIAANNLAARITPIRAAVSSETGSITIRVPKHHSGGATLEGGVKLKHETVEEVIQTIDIAALDRAIAGAGEIVVKIDVEGHEEVVLNQLAKSAHIGRITTVFYEVDDRWVTAERLASILAATGFRTFTKQSDGRHYDVLARR